MTGETLGVPVHPSSDEDAQKVSSIKPGPDVPRGGGGGGDYHHSFGQRVGLL